MRQLVSRCYGGIFYCERPHKLVYKGFENGKNEQQRLGSWTDGSEYVSYYPQKQSRGDSHWNHGEEPSKYKRAVDV